MKASISKNAVDFFQLFFPDYCLHCQNPIGFEKLPLCLNCRLDLPLTDFSRWSRNRLEKNFFGRIKLEAAVALFYYSRKGIVPKLINELKYKGNQSIGAYLGLWLGEKMRISKRFDKIDVIIPVPLHALKEKKRGYNQVHTFAQGLSEELNVLCDTRLLLKRSDHSSQTTKSRIERDQNHNLFYLSESEKAVGKHILLVDDVITSGATMMACIRAFEKISSVRFSLACIAFTP